MIFLYEKIIKGLNDKFILFFKLPMLIVVLLIISKEMNIFSNININDK